MLIHMKNIGVFPSLLTCTLVWDYHGSPEGIIKREHPQLRGMRILACHLKVLAGLVQRDTIYRHTVDI